MGTIAETGITSLITGLEDMFTFAMGNDLMKYFLGLSVGLIILGVVRSFIHR